MVFFVSDALHPIADAECDAAGRGDDDITVWSRCPSARTPLGAVAACETCRLRGSLWLPVLLGGQRGRLSGRCSFLLRPSPLSLFLTPPLLL